MGLSIRNIRNITVANVIVLGITGCSSSPAPWTQVDDSPWGEKRAEEQQLAAEVAVTEEELNDPVLLADTDPALETESIVLEQPEETAAPELIAPVVVEDSAEAVAAEEPAAEVTPQTAEQDIMAMLGSNYAVQVYASKTSESIERFKASKGLDDLMTVKTDRSGEIIFVLVDIYPDRASANTAATELEIKAGSKPWVRSLAGLQKIVAQ